MAERERHASEYGRATQEFGLPSGLDETTLETAAYVNTVTDGNGGTAIATVNVTITGINDPPTAVDDNPTFGEDARKVECHLVDWDGC